jgi:hypothetical protein
MAMATLTLSTEDGDVEIREDQLATLTRSDLRLLGISRKELLRCFAEGVELMKGRSAAERVRPIAERVPGTSTRMVLIVGYSPITDPLMNDGRKPPPRSKRN